MNKFCYSWFFLFSLLYGTEQNKSQEFYRKFLGNRTLGIPTSVIAGGGVAAGLKYLLHKNKFLSSFRAAEKIKHAPYWKSIGFGTLAGIGLYELLKRFTNPKKSDKSSESMKSPSSRSMENSKSKEEKPEVDYSEKIKITYICPNNLYSLFKLKDGLKTKTANEIENIISKGEIKKYKKIDFWLCSSREKFFCLMPTYLKDSEYAAVLYLIHENQKESFKNMFKESLSQSKSLLYDLYKIKPTSQEHLWCYALPLQSSVDDKGNKIYSLNISPEITERNIDSYSFQLTQDDATKINLGAEEDINGAEFMSRTNNVLVEVNNNQVTITATFKVTGEENPVPVKFLHKIVKK
jgi:hypothetical protein